jgi:hypothetical protein
LSNSAFNGTLGQAGPIFGARFFPVASPVTGVRLKFTAQATMVMAAVFAIICFGVAFTGFSSLGEIADPEQLENAKGFAWFWMFLASVAVAFMLAGWWAVHTQQGEGG